MRRGGRVRLYILYIADSMTKTIIITLLMVLLAGCSLDRFLPRADAPEQTGSSLVGDAERGAEIFRVGVGSVEDEVPTCSTCHRISASAFSLAQGPSLTGIGEEAGTRIDGMSAEEYLVDSILNPANFISANFRTSMYDEYGDHLSAQDVADLVAYMMTL